MRFLVDAQLPPALARWLSDQGHVAEHVAEHNLEAASDAAIWTFVVAASAVIVTKDEDFARWKALSKMGPPIVWIRIPNVRRRELLMWFEKALPEILSALERGETLIEAIGSADDARA
jgi:predicted nuclease of predicted toxin-antitoxin system